MRFSFSWLAKVQTILVVLVASIIFSFSVAPSAFAISVSEDPCNGGSCFQSGIDAEGLPNEIKKTADLKASIVSFINYLLTFVGVILLIMVIYAGFLMIASQGDDKVLEKSKKMFIYAFFGILLIVLSYTIVSWLANLGGNVQTSQPSTTISGSATPAHSADTSALQKEIDDLKKQLEALKNAPNPDATKIANLEKQLAALQSQMNTTTGSLQKSLDDLMNQFDALSSKGNLTTAEIVALKQTLDDLKKRSTGNPDLEKKYNDLLSLLDQLLANPNDATLFAKIRKAISDLGVQVGKSSEIMAQFTVSTSKKTVPTTLTLSAEKTYIRGAATKPIPNDAYVWSLITSDGRERVMGNGMQQSLELTESGNYIIRLQVASSDPMVIAGEATQSFLALPASTEASFLANGRGNSSALAFTMTDNTAGIVFTPNITPKTGRTISKVVWHFGRVKIDTATVSPVMYSFPKAGIYSVYLEAIDNTNETTKSATITISIQDLVSYFSLSKSQYLIDEPITFSGAPSKSDAGVISDFSWKFLNAKGETVSEVSGVNTIEKFSTPGTYTAVLTVKDSKGKTDSFYQNFSVISSNPVARFVSVSKGSDTPATYIFDATTSSDPSDSRLTYSWDFDGNGSFDKTGMSDPKVEYTFPKAGTYSVTLEVTNAFGKKATKTQKITVLSTLELKIEVPSITGTIQKEITFTAKHNGAKSFEWNFNDGTGKQMTNEAVQKHIFKQSGKYLVSLTAYDEANQKSVAQKMVFIGEANAPTAVVNAIISGDVLPWVENLCGSGKPGIIVHRNENVTFSAEGSVNKNGGNDSLSYTWQLPENNVDKTPNILWKFPKLSEGGKCEEITLKVTDTRSNTVSAPQTVWVSVENSKPKILSFTIGTPKSTIAPVSVPLTLKTSDADGGIRKYTWWATRVGGSSTDKIGLQMTTKANTMLLIPPFGDEGNTNDYLFHCEVEDNNGGITVCNDALGAFAPMSVKTLQNLSPKVTLVPDKKDIKLGDTIVFTAQAKTVDGVDISTLATYKWDFDGNNVFDDSTAVNMVSHKYVLSGKFTPRVKVTYQGLSTSATSPVVVQLTSKLPLSKIVATRSSTGSLLLDGSTSDFDKTVQGNALSYAWDFDTNTDSDGDGKKDNDVDSTSASAEAKYPEGTKRVRVKLTVKDAAGADDETLRSITLDSLSGIVSSASEKDKIASQEAIQVQEVIDGIKALLANPKPSAESIQTVKDKINTLKNTSSSAKTQSQLATLEGVLKKWEQNPADASNLSSQIDEVQKEVHDTITASGGVPSIISASKKELLASLSAELQTKAKNGTITETDIKKAEALLAELKPDVIQDVALSARLKKTQDLLATAKQNISDQTAVQKAVESLSALNNVAQNGLPSGSWKSLSDLGSKINRSLSFSTKNPSSVLDVYGGERIIGLGEKVSLFIFAKNADGSFYSGPVDLKMAEGMGTFSASSVQASGGRAIVDFIPTSTGGVTIEVSAKLVSGELKEKLTFTVEQ